MKKCFSLFLSTIFMLQLIITANAKTVTKENEDVVATFNTTTTSKNEKSNNSPIDKCGICVGDEDKDYYDHKTGPVIYDALDDIYGSAIIEESYDNAKVTAVVDAATGHLVSLTVEYDITCSINVGIVGSGNATGTAHILYKNFKY